MTDLTYHLDERTIMTKTLSFRCYYSFWCEMMLLFFTSKSLLIHRNRRIRDPGQILNSVVSLFSCETYCPNPELPMPNSLFPPSNRNYPPLIHHIRAEKSWNSIVDCIVGECDNLNARFAQDLISFGSVYLSVPDAKSVLINSQGSPGKRFEGMSRVIRVVNPNRRVPIGSYCRVHVNPRRYPLSYSVDWSKRIYTNNFTDYIFVNKISGVPTVPTVDNLRENVLNQVERAMKLNDSSLFVTSRIDACTSGILIFAKTSTASAAFNKLMMSRRVTKIYKVLCNSAVKLGKLTHLFPKRTSKHENAKPTLLRAILPEHLEVLSKSDDRGEDGISEADGSRWQLAELTVLSCEEIKRGKHFSKESTSYLKGNSLWDTAEMMSGDRYSDEICELESLFEVSVRLETGRTHQIRLQLAAEGSAVLGDSRYGPAEGLLDTRYEASTPSSSKQRGDGSDIFGPEPQSVGLHCSEMTFPIELFKSKSESAEVDSAMWTLQLQDLSLICDHNSGISGTTVLGGKPPWRI